MGRGNPFRLPVQGMQNPMQRLMDIANKATELQRNPSKMADVLLERGAIDQKSYEAMKGMSPSQIGQYMMQNGMIGQQQAQAAYQNVPHVQNMMK